MQKQKREKGKYIKNFVAVKIILIVIRSVKVKTRADLVLFRFHSYLESDKQVFLNFLFRYIQRQIIFMQT